MTVQTKSREWLLRWKPTGAPCQSVLSRIRGNHDFLPDDSCIFHPVAAQTAAALSMSAQDEKLVRENLSALGYGDIAAVGCAQPGRDKIGFYMGSRIQNDLLQVAVVLRGTGGDEWYSNFEIGYSAEHSGFAKAADYAEEKLGDYVFTRAIGMEPQFFITGFSRGGAVAGILAKRLSDRYGLERVCAYTFASPATTISRRVNRYRSIFNFVRQEDFFTRVPLAGWGYTRYGRDISLSDVGDITLPFRQLTGEDYIGFTRQTAVDHCIGTLMTLAPNVYAYYKRRREVGERRVSLYELTRCVADMLSAHMDDAVADLFVTAMGSDYADLINFLSSGADLGELIASSSAAPSCSVADSHSPAAYMAALDLYLRQQPAVLAHTRP